jgi:hypothetical protein
MLLWLDAADRPQALANSSRLPAGASVTITAPPAPAAPVLQYAFVTGEASNPMAPSAVNWPDGLGINTDRDILAGADYLYDTASGMIGFRVPPND